MASIGPRVASYFSRLNWQILQATGRFGKPQADLQLLEADFANLLWVHVKGLGLVTADFSKSASRGTNFVLRGRAKYEFLDLFILLLTYLFMR